MTLLSHCDVVATLCIFYISIQSLTGSACVNECVCECTSQFHVCGPLLTSPVPQWTPVTWTECKLMNFLPKSHQLQKNIVETFENTNIVMGQDWYLPQHMSPSSGKTLFHTCCCLPDQGWWGVWGGYSHKGTGDPGCNLLYRYMFPSSEICLSSASGGHVAQCSIHTTYWKRTILHASHPNWSPAQPLLAACWRKFKWTMCQKLVKSGH